MTTTLDTRSRTDRQVAYIVDLLRRIGEFDARHANHLWATLKETDAKTGLTVTMASDVITTLREKLEALREHTAVTVPEGRYAVDTEEGHLAFYRVVVHESGRVSVYVFASDAQHKLPEQTAQSVLRKINSAGVQQALERFGRELGICGMCGRSLTDAESRAQGMGPVCAAKLMKL